MSIRHYPPVESVFCRWAKRATNPIMTSEAAETLETLTVRIWRGQEDGALQTYRIPARANQTVLDVVTEVQRRHEPTLAYRFACRVGVCGSCAMTVNGTPRWACRTHVKKVAKTGKSGESELTIEPLRNLPRIKDLVCDMSEFFDKWTRAGGRFKSATTRHDPPSLIAPQNPRRKRADAGIECINCGICYAACDVVGWDRDYLGPAALNRAWTLVNDDRAINAHEVAHSAQGVGGCGSCHSHGACLEVCPMDLNPTRSIAGLKKQSLAALFGLNI